MRKVCHSLERAGRRHGPPARHDFMLNLCLLDFCGNIGWSHAAYEQKFVASRTTAQQDDGAFWAIQYL
jgi:hypothetical protein